MNAQKEIFGLVRTIGLVLVLVVAVGMAVAVGDNLKKSSASPQVGTIVNESTKGIITFAGMVTDQLLDASGVILVLIAGIWAAYAGYSYFSQSGR